MKKFKCSECGAITTTEKAMRRTTTFFCGVCGEERPLICTKCGLILLEGPSGFITPPKREEFVCSLCLLEEV